MSQHWSVRAVGISSANRRGNHRDAEQQPIEVIEDDALRQFTLQQFEWCRSTRISACKAGCGRNSPITTYQISLETSPIAAIITRFAGDRQRIGFTVGTGRQAHLADELANIGGLSQVVHHVAVISSASTLGNQPDASGSPSPA